MVWLYLPSIPYSLLKSIDVIMNGINVIIFSKHLAKENHYS